MKNFDTRSSILQLLEIFFQDPWDVFLPYEIASSGGFAKAQIEGKFP